MREIVEETQNVGSEACTCGQVYIIVSWRISGSFNRQL